MPRIEPMHSALPSLSRLHLTGRATLHYALPCVESSLMHLIVMDDDSNTAALTLHIPIVDDRCRIEVSFDGKAVHCSLQGLHLSSYTDINPCWLVGFIYSEIHPSNRLWRRSTMRLNLRKLFGSYRNVAPKVEARADRKDLRFDICVLSSIYSSNHPAFWGFQKDHYVNAPV